MFILDQIKINKVFNDSATFHQFEKVQNWLFMIHNHHSMKKFGVKKFRKVMMINQYTEGEGKKEFQFEIGTFPKKAIGYMQ